MYTDYSKYLKSENQNVIIDLNKIFWCSRIILAAKKLLGLFSFLP